MRLRHFWARTERRDRLWGRAQVSRSNLGLLAPGKLTLPARGHWKGRKLCTLGDAVGCHTVQIFQAFMLSFSMSFSLEFLGKFLRPQTTAPILS